MKMKNPKTNTRKRSQWSWHTLTIGSSFTVPCFDTIIDKDRMQNMLSKSAWHFRNKWAPKHKFTIRRTPAGIQVRRIA